MKSLEISPLNYNSVVMEILQIPSLESHRGSCTTWRLHGAGEAMMLTASFGPNLISYSSHVSALHSSVSLCSFTPILFFSLFIYSKKD